MLICKRLDSTLTLLLSHQSTCCPFYFLSLHDFFSSFSQSEIHPQKFQKTMAVVARRQYHRSCFWSQKFRSFLVINGLQLSNAIDIYSKITGFTQSYLLSHLKLNGPLGMFFLIRISPFYTVYGIRYTYDTQMVHKHRLISSQESWTKEIQSSFLVLISVKKNNFPFFLKNSCSCHHFTLRIKLFSVLLN